MIRAKSRSLPQMSCLTENVRENVRKFLNGIPCDSVHSVNERKKTNRGIFVPSQYVQLIQDAGTKSPDKAWYIDHFFKDFSTIRE